MKGGELMEHCKWTFNLLISLAAGNLSVEVEAPQNISRSRTRLEGHCGGRRGDEVCYSNSFLRTRKGTTVAASTW